MHRVPRAFAAFGTQQTVDRLAPAAHDSPPRPQRPASRDRVAARGPALRPLALAAALLAGWPAAHADVLPDPASIDRQNQVIERQQLEQLRREQERALPPVRPPGGADLGSEVAPARVAPMAQCREIREIRIEGASLLRTDLRARVDADFAGRCLGTSELEQILGLVTKHYIDRGFVTTRAYLPAQDLATGILKVAVVEGRIESIRMPPGRGPAASTLFPAAAGDFLNLRDLEQGIDQFNSVASNDARLDLRPGSEPGMTVVEVLNAPSRPLHLLLSLDDSGTDATGRYNASATLSFDGIFGLNELIAVTGRRSVPNDPSHRSDTTAVRVSVPLGYSTLSADFSESRYVNVLTLPSGQPLQSDGRTTTQGIGADHVVYRDQDSRYTLGARLTRSITGSNLGGERLEVSSRTLTTAELSLSGFRQLGGGVANGRLAWVRGLRIGHALHDAPGLLDSMPHAQFDKFMLDLGYVRRFAIQEQPVHWTSQFSAQQAQQVLYGSQQMLIGGQGTVRGFKDSTLSGDHGWLWRNELALPWRTAGSDGPALVGRVFGALDVGRVWGRAPGADHGTLVGAGIGATVQWKGASLEPYISRSLRAPAGVRREGTLFGVRLSFAM